jgi:hypothetical protein
MGILDLHVLLSLYLVKNLSTRAGKQVSIFAFKERESAKKYNTTRRKASKYPTQIGIGAATWRCMSRARSQASILLPLYWRHHQIPALSVFTYRRPTYFNVDSALAFAASKDDENPC